jgi:hypothetical protein
LLRTKAIIAPRIIDFHPGTVLLAALTSAEHRPCESSDFPGTVAELYLRCNKDLPMFGISPLGWVHTLGSLPAIPMAVYMFARHGRIVPRSTAGAVYFFSMLIGGVTVFLVAKEPVADIIGVVTLLLLLVGYGVGRLPTRGRAAVYVETISLTLTTFLLALPTVTETLRRVPDGHPFAADPKAPLLVDTQGALLVALIVGVAAQLFYLRKHSRLALALPD